MQRSQLIKRLEAIEHRLLPDEATPNCIKILRVDQKGNPEPIMGWKENGHKEPIEVWRLPNESDDDLADRALATMQARPGRHPLAVVVMFQLVPEDQQKE
jgi:hypothetical protein